MTNYAQNDNKKNTFYNKLTLGVGALLLAVGIGVSWAFAPKEIYTLPENAIPIEQQYVDLNKDGYLDLVVTYKLNNHTTGKAVFMGTEDELVSVLQWEEQQRDKNWGKEIQNVLDGLETEEEK